MIDLSSSSTKSFFQAALLVLPMMASVASADIEQQAVARTRWLTLSENPVDAERCSGFRVIDGVSAIVDGWRTIYHVHQEKHIYENGFWQPTGETRTVTQRGPCVLVD